MIENGIDECLQLLCSIIQGLSVPIKQEYILILNNVLIPLHKVNIRTLNKFNESLLKCLIQLIIKDANIGLYIIENLLKYWPFQSASKCDLFSKELIVIVNTMMFDINIDNINNENDKQKEINLFKYNLKGIKIREAIISKLISLIICDNYCLCEKALLSFSEDGIQKLIDCNKQKTWNKILKVLFDQKNNKRHWCKKLEESYDNVLNLFINRDEKFVQKFENIHSQMCDLMNININEFKEGFYKNGYNPIYPNKKLLFNCQKNRIKKYKQLQIMANKNKKKLLKKYKNKNKNKKYIPNEKSNQKPRKLKSKRKIMPKKNGIINGKNKNQTKLSLQFRKLNNKHRKSIPKEKKLKSKGKIKPKKNSIINGQTHRKLTLTPPKNPPPKLPKQIKKKPPKPPINMMIQLLKYIWIL